jgi:HEAT repeat protein
MLAGAEVDDDLVIALGGAHGERFLAGHDAPYWGRVWGARGLLYVWNDAATPELIEASVDPSWRVREMVAKVVAKRRLDDAASAVAQLCGDPVPRVRQAAERALAAISRDQG